MLNAIIPGPDKASLIKSLQAMHDASTPIWVEFPESVFFAPQGTSWSPAEHCRHLNTSIRAVTRGMKMPKVALLGFGVSLKGSQTYEEVKAHYLQVLKDGAKATGPYIPKPNPEDMSLSEWRSIIMTRWEESAASLQEAIQGWTEASLDRYRLPHPWMGNLTVREMLFFTLYHNQHHIKQVYERAVRSSRANSESDD